MSIRLATTSDLPRISQVAAEAFQNEELQAYRFPHRKEHPQGWLDFWYYTTQGLLLGPGAIVWVVEVENEIKKKEIASVCAWQVMPYSEYGNTSQLPLAKDSWQEGLQRTLAAYRAKIYRWLVKDLAKADDELFEDFKRRIQTSFKDYWMNEEGKMRLHWHIAYICTAPKHQKKGYGSQLIRWGTKQADKDGLDIGVNAAPAAMVLYEKHGLVHIGDIPLPSGLDSGMLCKRVPKKNV